MSDRSPNSWPAPTPPAKADPPRWARAFGLVVGLTLGFCTVVVACGATLKFLVWLFR